MSRSPFTSLSDVKPQAECHTTPADDWHLSPSPITPQKGLASPNGLSSSDMINTSPNRPLLSPQSFFGSPVTTSSFVYGDQFHQDACEFFESACNLCDEWVLPHGEKNGLAEMINVVADAFEALCDAIEHLVNELRKINRDENAIIKAYDACCAEMSLFRRDIEDFKSQVSSFNPSPK